MKLRVLVSVLTLLLLTGCGASSGIGIPSGLEWRAQSLQSQEDGAILAAYGQQDVPSLDVTAQVEGGTVTLTDHASGKTYTGTLSPMEGTAPGEQIYALTFPGVPEGYGVYGVTEYAGGGREATLYLVDPEAGSLRLTAPLT